MTPRIGRVLSGLHHRIANSLKGRQPHRGRDGRWVYPPLTEAMADSGLQEVDTYVSCHQNTLSQFIATRPIMELCLEE